MIVHPLLTYTPAHNNNINPLPPKSMHKLHSNPTSPPRNNRPIPVLLQINSEEDFSFNEEYHVLEEGFVEEIGEG